MFTSQVTRIFLLIMGVCSAGYSQTSMSVPVSVTFAEKVGVTAPLRHLAPLNATSEERRKQAKQSKKTVPNFYGRGSYIAANGNALPQGIDPVLQTTAPQRNNSISVTPNLNMEGMNTSMSNANVPDPVGDIGQDHYVQVINSTFIKICDKQGNEIAEPIAANTLWASLGFSSGGDPIILYDHDARRWILTEFPNFQGGNRLLIAVSENADPLGSWSVYNFGTVDFPDYPKYSIWPNALVLTTNEGNGSELPAYFIDRQALLDGSDDITIQRLVIPGVATGPGFQVATPVDWNGPAPQTGSSTPLLLKINDDAWGEVANDQIELITVNLDFDNADSTTIAIQEIPTAPYDTRPCTVEGPGFACIPQLGGTGIDGLPEVIMNQSHYRKFEAHESIVLNFITDANGNNRSGIRWMELRRTSGSAWTVFQEGTFAPDDGLHRFMGAIAIDGGGNIGLAYSVSGPTIYPGLRFTGRRVDDQPGEMTIEEYTLVEGSGSTSNDRYGDYAHLGIDPQDNRSFWFTGQYMTADGWSTRIASFQIEKDTFDIGPVGLESPQNSPVLSSNETVSVRVKNQGLSAVSGFNIGYIFENQAAVIESVNTVLPPGATYLHEFNPTVDVSAIGDYNFKFFTDNTLDLSRFNDTLNAVVTRLPQFDIGIIDLRGLELYSCNDSITAEYDLFNFGTQNLTSGLIDINLNGETVQTINWQGTLTPGNSITLSLLVENIMSGNNTLELVAYAPNGMTDQRSGNNTVSRGFGVSGEEKDITLTIALDQYPNETTWEVTDVQDNILFSGGPYQTPFATASETWCLDPSQCYRLTLYDSYGDGFCCATGEGNYTLTDPEGMVLTQGDGAIAVQKTIDFCVDFTCMLTAEVTVGDAQPNQTNGIIFMEPGNGLPPYQYSIDNGENFQTNHYYTGLEAGTYSIEVKDQNGCSYTEIVTINMLTSTHIFPGETTVSIYPNPTTGVFKVAIAGIPADRNHIDLEIFSATGQWVQSVKIPNYDGDYTGLVSLTIQPAGIYYLKFKSDYTSTLFRVVKL